MRTNAKVYVMTGNNGLVKVGHSRNPKGRLNELRRRAVSVEYETGVLREAEQIERSAHRLLQLAGRHVRGEWFASSVAEAIQAIERAIEIVSGLQLPLDRRPQNGYEVLCISGPGIKPMLDDLRRMEPDIPTRSEMVRRMILRAATKTEKKRA